MSTVIIPTSNQAAPVNPENLAFVNEQIERVREIAGWKNFGTIGYEAYADWVLEESLSARIKVA